MEFLRKPFQERIPGEYKMDSETKILLDIEVNKLVDKGAIQISNHQEDQFVSNLFLVRQEGKNRPIINFRKLNEFVEYKHFQMENSIDLKHL